MRISLTDACNLRCVYCMPEQMTFRRAPRVDVRRGDHPSCASAASLGVNKIRLTGGEPTIRPGIVGAGAGHCGDAGRRDLAMTTNAVLLDKLARRWLRLG
jgi:cyclic pyranopterin phosphate synthase